MAPLPAHTADALTRLALALARVDTLDDVLWAVAHEAIATLRLEDCVVYLVDHSRQVCVQRAAFGPKNPQSLDILNPIEIPVGVGIVGSVAKSAQSIRVDDTRVDSRYIVDDASRASELAVPIIHRDQVIGVLDSEHSAPSFFTPAHEEVFSAIAALASTRIAAAVLQQELVAARDAAEAAVVAKRNFLLMMHHELRTPLHGILGVTALLESRLTDAENRQLLALADQSARGLMTMLEDVLTVADLGQDRMTLAMSSYDPLALLRSVVELFAGEAHTRGVRLSAIAAGVVPARVEGDVARVRQVLMHLLSNANKFTKAGRVDAVVSSSGDRITFAIRDTGIGISPELLPTLLEPFTQERGGTTRPYQGAGLGLAVAKGVTERMGGQLTLTSTPGKGTTATLSLPIRPTTHASAPD